MNDWGTFGWFLLCIVLIFLILFAYIVVFKKIRSKEKIEEAELKAAVLSEEVDDSYIYRLLELHHVQALQQSGIQFWFSIFAAVVGFLFIIFMLIRDPSGAWYDNLVKLLPAAVTEAVSVLFIRQAKETREKAEGFFKELSYEKQVARSIELAESIEDVQIKSDIKAKIALYLVGIGGKESVQLKS